MATIRERLPGVIEVRVFVGRDEAGRPVQVSRTVRGELPAPPLLHLPEAPESSAAAQVTTNTPTMMKPAALMLNPAMLVQNRPRRCSSVGRSPSTSMVPMKRQMATDED